MTTIVQLIMSLVRFALHSHIGLIRRGRSGGAPNDNEIYNAAFSHTHSAIG